MNIISKLIITLSLWATTALGGMTPIVGTNVLWIDGSNVWQITDGIAERYHAVQNQNLTGYYDTWYISTNYACTNFIWNLSNYRISTQYQVNWDQALYIMIPNYYKCTTYDTLGFDDTLKTNLVHWTTRTMYEYLTNNFVNTDGTKGVGVFTNYPALTDTNWLWEVTWDTNATKILLGSLTYMVTNMVYTNIPPNPATNLYYLCGWKYTDGGRIVHKARSKGNNVPPEWMGFSANSFWWTVYSLGGTWQQSGLVFDWIDYTCLSNKLTFTSGNTNLSIMSTNGFNLKIIGRTNYVWNGIYNKGGFGGMFTQTEDFIISPCNTNLFTTLGTTVYDLGGYLPTNNALYFWDGLQITNREAKTDISGTNHLGDTFYLWLYIGKDGDNGLNNYRSSCRLYDLPHNTNDYLIGYPYENLGVNTRAGLQPFVNREMLSARGAILQLLRVSDWANTPDPDYWWFPDGVQFWKGVYANNKGESIGSHFPFTWALAKAYAISGWYTAYTEDGPPYAYVQGENDTDQFVAYAERKDAFYKIPYSTGGGYYFYTNVPFRVDFYVCATNQTGPNYLWPPDDGLSEFDANGDDVLPYQWRQWDSVTYAAGRPLSSFIQSSIKLGDVSGGCPVMPLAAPGTDLSHDRGWVIDQYGQKALIYWQFKWCMENPF